MKLSRTFGYLLAMTIVCIGLMAFGADHANASHAVTLASLTGFDPGTLAMLPAAAGMAGSTSKAKRFRVATSGPTIDGREIKPEWLKQAADNYDPAVYAARVNVEHLRGYSADGPFGAFGDVIAFTAETNKKGRVELFADIEPNDRAIAANKAGQKVYTSIELIENFAGTGQAYCVGLAMTDTPASLGTERLQFSAAQLADGATYTAKTFTGLGAKAGALAFGLAAPTEVDLTPEKDAGTAIADTFAALRDKFTARFKAADKTTVDLATEVATTLDAFAAATADQIGQAAERYEKLSADHAAMQTAHNQLTDDFAALKTQLASEPAAGQSRKPSTGGNANAAGLAEF